jgi:hypothetical protein
MKITALASVAAAAGLSFAVTSTVVAQENSKVRGSYGALAVVPGQGRDFHGFATAKTIGTALDAALAQCGDKRCRLVKAYGPGQCVHIVLGERQIFWNSKLFSSREKEFVLAGCEKVDRECKTVFSECLPE